MGETERVSSKFLTKQGLGEMIPLKEPDRWQIYLVVMVVILGVGSVTITRGSTEEPRILFEGQRSVPVGTYNIMRVYSFFQHMGVGWNLDPSLRIGEFTLLLLNETGYANYSAGQTYSFEVKIWQGYNQTAGRHYAGMYTTDVERDTEYVLVVDNTSGSETLVISLKIVGGSSREELRALLEPMVRNYAPFSLPPFLMLALSTGGGLLGIGIRRQHKASTEDQ